MSVALDGKSAIEGTLVRESRPGHYLTDLLHSRIEAVKKRRTGLEFTLRWLPGHHLTSGHRGEARGRGRLQLGRAPPTGPAKDPSS